MRKTQLSSMTRKRKEESPRDAALRILKIRGEMSLVELTRSLKLTETAVRRHLAKLQQLGLITCTSRHQPHGRPLNVYKLTEQATTEYFPTGYEELAEELLDTIFDTEGHKGVFDFLLAANQYKIKQLNQMYDGLTTEQKVKALVDYFTKTGYMTDFRSLKDGRYFLYHQNCAIYNIASKYRQLCFVELRLIEAVTKARVTRQQYIFKRQPICGYLIDPTSEND